MAGWILKSVILKNTPMRTKIVAGNWKMNLNRDESLQLILDISTAIQQHDLKGNRVMVFPPFVTIGYVMDSGNRDHRIEVGAQNMHQEESGAYTGEVAAKMLSNMGVNSVILGHSERREYFNETDSLLKQKVDTARSNGLEVVFVLAKNWTSAMQEIILMWWNANWGRPFFTCLGMLLKLSFWPMSLSGLSAQG